MSCSECDLSGEHVRRRRVKGNKYDVWGAYLADDI